MSGRKRKRKYATDEERDSVRKEQRRRSWQTRIHLGSTYERWEQQRRVCGDSHQDFAKHLLAIHETYCDNFKGVKATAAKNRNIRISEETLFEDIPENEPDMSLEFVPGTPQRKHKKKDECQSPFIKDFVIPLSKGMTSTPYKGVKSDDSGEEEEEIQDLDVTNVAFDPDWDEEDEDDTITLKGNISVSMSMRAIQRSNKCIAFNECLLNIVQKAVGGRCNKCRTALVFNPVLKGTCLVVKWQCKEGGVGHTTGSWASQPRFQGMYAGNLLTSSCILLSGNSHHKLGLFAKFLKLGFIGEASFYRIQNKYIAPAVKTYWQGMQEKLYKNIHDPLVLAGDGRSDSPGYCAKYTTYSLMDVSTKSVVALQVVDCREAELKSPNMEKLGFIRAMEAVMAKKSVAEVVTDAHPQIKALMKKDPRYKDVQHQFDMWHVARTLTKKLVEAGNQKGCKVIHTWTPVIKNHLWYAAQKCAGDVNILKDTWTSVIHHVCNKHEWLDKSGQRVTCNHDVPVTASHKPWIQSMSRPYHALKNVIFDKKLLEKMVYICNYRHTSDLELFNSHLLMYCPKRHAYSYEGYKIRNMLAVIDYNEHIGRSQAVDKDGKPRYSTNYSKATKQWTAQAVKVQKAYAHIDDLIFIIMNERVGATEPLSAKAWVDPEDPRKLQPTIAAKPKPPKQQLIDQREARNAMMKE